MCAIFNDLPRRPLDVNIFRVTPSLEWNRSDKLAIKAVITDSPPVASTSASTSLSRLFKTLPQMLTSQPHRLSSTHTTPLPTLRLRPPSFLPLPRHRTAISTSIASAASPISNPVARMAAPADTDRFVAAANTSTDAPADMDGFVAAANTAADAAGEVIRKYFRKSFDILDKDDLSPVTIADRDAEEAMMSTILESFPSHAIFGEENGWRCKEESADYVWVLDPIDGTKSFITGKPLFGTLIALLHKGKPIVGIIDQPILRERWIGMSGRRTTMNGREVSTRDCSGLSQAYLYTTSPHLFTGEAEEAFSRIRNKVKVPLYGCDCYAYALLASGFVDLVVESGLKPYDFLSLVPVIEGAGGLITDWSGRKLHWEASPHVHVTSFNVAAAGDPQLHTQALNALEWQ